MYTLLEAYMHIHVNGKNIEITDAIKAYVKEKLGKVVNHYDQIQGIKVILTVIKNPSASGKHVAEVKCTLSSGTVVHVEESAESMYASIDLIADKLDRQVKKVKSKSLYADKNTIRNTDVEVVEVDDEDEVEDVKAID